MYNTFSSNYLWLPPPININQLSINDKYEAHSLLSLFTTECIRNCWSNPHTTITTTTTPLFIGRCAYHERIKVLASTCIAFSCGTHLSPWVVSVPVLPLLDISFLWGHFWFRIINSVADGMTACHSCPPSWTWTSPSPRIWWEVSWEVLPPPSLNRDPGPRRLIGIKLCTNYGPLVIRSKDCQVSNMDHYSRVDPNISWIIRSHKSNTAASYRDFTSLSGSDDEGVLIYLLPSQKVVALLFTFNFRRGCFGWIAVWARQSAESACNGVVQ